MADILPLEELTMPGPCGGLILGMDIGLSISAYLFRPGGP